MSWILGVFGAVLLADFLSGLAHWLEDCYFSPETPLLGHTILKNVEHHRDPLLFVKNAWHVTIRSSLVAAVFLGLVLGTVGLLSWFWLAALAISVFANQVHKWAHMPAGTIPRFVRMLQEARVLQAPAHHLQHHRGSRDTHYCVVTNLLNPVLDGVYFWRALEIVVEGLSGRKPRADVPVNAV
jgi:plasmanylethanolamine desaturase